MSRSDPALEALRDLAEVKQLIRSGGLRISLDEARVSQSEVAFALGVSAAAVNRWCNARRFPRTGTALRLAELLRLLGNPGLGDPEGGTLLPHPPSEHGESDLMQRLLATCDFQQEKIRSLRQEIERLENIVAGYRRSTRRMADYLDATSRDGLPVIAREGITNTLDA